MEEEEKEKKEHKKKEKEKKKRKKKEEREKGEGRGQERRGGQEEEGEGQKKISLDRYTLSFGSLCICTVAFSWPFSNSWGSLQLSILGSGHPLVCRGHLLNSSFFLVNPSHKDIISSLTASSTVVETKNRLQ